MNQENIIKYHIWFNLIFGAYNTILSIITLLDYVKLSFKIPIMLIYPTPAMMILTIVIGIFTLIYYLTKKANFKLVILSVLNIILLPIIFIFPLSLIAPFYLILMFFYTLFIKLKKNKSAAVTYYYTKKQ